MKIRIPVDSTVLQRASAIGKDSLLTNTFVDTSVNQTKYVTKRPGFTLGYGGVTNGNNYGIYTSPNTGSFYYIAGNGQPIFVNYFGSGIFGNAYSNTFSYTTKDSATVIDPYDGKPRTFYPLGDVFGGPPVYMPSPTNDPTSLTPYAWSPTNVTPTRTYPSQASANAAAFAFTVTQSNGPFPRYVGGATPGYLNGTSLFLPGPTNLPTVTPNAYTVRVDISYFNGTTTTQLILYYARFYF